MHLSRSKIQDLSKMTHIQLIEKVTAFLFICLLAYLGYNLVSYHYLLMTQPYPAEYREAAMLVTTDLLLKGQNPYALANMPMAANVYGIVYSLLVYPFAKIWGATFLVHRAVSGICILCACLWFFSILKYDGVHTLYSLSAVFIEYAGLLYYVTPCTRPDSLGVLLFLLSIYLPYRSGYSKQSLCISSIIGVLAFFTKPYFILSILYVGTYTFLCVSKKKGILYSFFSAILLLATSLMANHLLETYFLNTFFTHKNGGVTNNFDFLIKQLKFYWEINYGIVFLVCFIIGYVCYTAFLHHSFGALRQQGMALIAKSVNILDLDAPCITLHFPYSLYCFLCSWTVIYCKMGRNDGAWMNYFFQLLTPFLLISSYNAIKYLNRGKQRFLPHYRYFVVICCVVMTMIGAYSYIPIPIVDIYDAEKWRDVENLIASHHNIFNTPLIANFLIAQQKPVYDSGHTEAFAVAHYDLPFLKHFLPDNEAAKKTWDDYVQMIEQSVRQQKFDLIIVNNFYPTLISRKILAPYYTYETSKEVCTFHEFTCIWLDIWQPKNLSHK